MTMSAELTSLATNRQAQPKVQHMVATPMGNTSRVIWALKITFITFMMLKDGYKCRCIMSKTRSNKSQLQYNTKDKMTPFLR